MPCDGMLSTPPVLPADFEALAEALLRLKISDLDHS